MKRITLIVILYFTFLNSYAESAAAEGFYSSQTAQLQVIMLDPEKGIVAAKASVNHGHCFGYISGIGTIVGRKLTLSPYTKLGGPGPCSLAIDFDSKWRSATLIENEYCTWYHGAACGWEGQSIAKKSDRR